MAIPGSPGGLIIYQGAGYLPSKDTVQVRRLSSRKQTPRRSWHSSARLLSDDIDAACCHSAGAVLQEPPGSRWQASSFGGWCQGETNGEPVRGPPFFEKEPKIGPTRAFPFAFPVILGSQ